jgi:phosphate transport system substrate-binding protein
VRSKHRGLWRILALLFTLTLIAAACGDDDDDGGDDAAASDDGGGDVSGEVNVTGSSTVEPISTAVAELFQEQNGDVTVNVDGPGTGDGFELFCNGEADINDASRPIEPDDGCEDAGTGYIELPVGIDGLSVLTSGNNADVSCLTFADLYALVGPESEGFDNWSDAQPLASELGSTTEFPDAALDITAPGEESGTYSSFIDLALADIAEQRVEAGAITEDQAETTRPDYQASADDNVIIEGIEGSDSSLGWVGFAFAENAGDQVKEIEIDGGDGCTAPSTETIEGGSYPLSRTLYIYVAEAKAADSPALEAYVDFYLGDDGIAQVEEVGYVALPDDQLEESRTVWEDRTTGTRAG